MRSNQSSRALRATALFLLAGTLHTAAYAVPESNVPAAVDGIAAIQQMRTVKGVVVDEAGEPVIGATVMLTNDHTKGTVTNVDGEFTLDVPANATLQISTIGYKTVQVKATATPMKIVLAEDVNLLDDVVVIGYGTARKGDLTGAISSVKGQKIEERASVQLTDALQGQIAGLQVTRSGGAPGSSGSIRVRGVTTMSTNDPLVIVDGVPGSLNDIMGTDVQDITVLKDAAAAAIYGSRAAAGVILVTTKRAETGKFSIDYNYEYSIDKPTARPTNGDAVDWMNFQNEIKYNDGAKDPYSQYSQDFINSYMEKNATDPYHYANTNWVDVLLKNTASHQQHSLAVTGGTDKLKTKFTMNYQTADGYYKYRSYDRYAGRINNDWKINNWIAANVDANFSYSESQAPSNNSVMYHAYLTSPFYPVYTPDGKYADVKDGGNALSALEQGGTSNTRYYKFAGKAQLTLTPIKGLTLTGIVAPRFTMTKGKSFGKQIKDYYESGATILNQYHKTTSLSESRNDTYSITYQAYANYQNKWNDHSFNAMVGYEGYTYKWENLGASRTNYLLTTFPYLNLGPEDYQYNNGSAGHNAYQSVFGRVMYSYKDRYMIQANIRADGSSRFAPGCRWATFPSVSAGWVISEEPWYNKDNSAVPYLKLRASVGSLGNERIGSEFPYMASMNFGNSYMYDKGAGSVTALQNAAQVYYAFRDITWETTTTYGVGVDASFLDSRLRFTGDWYYKKTKNMLLTLGFPSYAGFSAPQQNAGDMNTKGWDVELSWSDKIGKDWTYSVSFNLSDYRSKMGYLGDKKTVNGNHLLEEGSYYNEWYMYKTDGLFWTDADLKDENGNPYPTLTKNDKAGNIKYIDIDGNGVINADDKVRLGNSLPEYLYGGNITVGYKNFDLAIGFQGIGHQNVLFNTTWIQPLREQWGAIPSLILTDYWSQHNTEEQNRAAKYPRLTWTNTTNTYTGSDYWLFNGAYFRFKNITLGYTLPKEWAKKIFMQGLRVYASIKDLPAFSKYPKGWDPESSGNSEFISTSFSFGVNVKF